MTTAFADTSTLDRDAGKTATTGTIGRSDLSSLTEAVKQYFDLMYDCDTSRFHAVFRETAHLHGFRDGRMVVWSGQTYKDILDERQSPMSRGATRLDEILMMDFAAPDMAFVKVRVRIAAMVFVDYLTWHKIDGEWRITSKGFHLEYDDDNQNV